MSNIQLTISIGIALYNIMLQSINLENTNNKAIDLFI